MAIKLQALKKAANNNNSPPPAPNDIPTPPANTNSSQQRDYFAQRIAASRQRAGGVAPNKQVTPQSTTTTTAGGDKNGWLDQLAELVATADTMNDSATKNLLAVLQREIRQAQLSSQPSSPAVSATTPPRYNNNNNSPADTKYPNSIQARQEYFLARIAESRRKVGQPTTTTSKPAVVPPVTQGDYFANRIAASRQRALLANIYKTTKSNPAATRQQPGGTPPPTIAVNGAFGSKNSNSGASRITTPSSIKPTEQQEYFRHRIQASRQRALLASIKEASRDASTLSGGVLPSSSSRSKPGLPAPTQPKSTAKVVPRSKSRQQEYFRDRIAASRQRALMTKIQQSKTHENTFLGSLKKQAAESAAETTTQQDDELDALPVDSFTGINSASTEVLESATLPSDTAAGSMVTPETATSITSDTMANHAAPQSSGVDMATISKIYAVATVQTGTAPSLSSATIKVPPSRNGTTAPEGSAIGNSKTMTPFGSKQKTVSKNGDGGKVPVNTFGGNRHATAGAAKASPGNQQVNGATMKTPFAPTAGSSATTDGTKAPWSPNQGGTAKQAWEPSKADGSTKETGTKVPFPPIQGGSKPAWSPPKNGSNAGDVESKMPFPPIQGGSKPAWSSPKASSSTTETESKKPFPPIQGGSKPAWSPPKASGSTMETESKKPFPPIQGGSKPTWSPPKNGSNAGDVESKTPFPPIQGGSKPTWSPPKASSSTTETESKKPFPPIQGGSKPAWSSPKASSSTTETESKTPFPPIQGGSKPA
eukprot:scaffold4374_cov165-Amphora_coffeaeformis.AAC.7